MTKNPTICKFNIYIYIYETKLNSMPIFSARKLGSDKNLATAHWDVDGYAREIFYFYFELAKPTSCVLGTHFLIISRESC